MSSAEISYYLLAIAAAVGFILVMAMVCKFAYWVSCKLQPEQHPELRSGRPK